MGLEQLSHRGQGVLVRLESTSAELAEEIAARLNGRSQDLRDAVRVARLAPSLGVERAVPRLPVGGRGCLRGDYIRGSVEKSHSYESHSCSYD